MNNSTYNAYVLLEELAELTQAAVKCMRWGGDSRYKATWKTNEEQMFHEFNDVMAMLELLSAISGKPTLKSKTTVQTVINAATIAQKLLMEAIEENELELRLNLVADVIVALDLPVNNKQIKSKKQRVAFFKDYSMARGILEVNRKVSPTEELVYYDWLSKTLAEKKK